MNNIIWWLDNILTKMENSNFISNEKDFEILLYLRKVQILIDEVKENE